MAANIFGVLGIGKSALLNQQLAIEVTGQNIANVQTEGYSKQSVRLEANAPRSFGLGSIGTGVRIAGIERSHDQFVFSQIVSENSNLSNFDIRKNVFDQMEILFDNNFGGGINESLSAFFAGLQDLANNPGGLAERANVVGTAKSLVQEFRRVGEGLFQQRINADQTIESEVTEINDLITQIRDLNRSIFESEARPGFGANDLRDRRDKLVNDLAKKIDVQISDETDGILSITLSNGSPLVLGLESFSLGVSANGNNSDFKDIILNDSQSTNITSQISGGKLKGLIDMRDTEVKGALDKLDRFAAAFAQEFNRIHNEGFAFDGSTGINFFSTLTPSVVGNTSNTGSASISATNASPTTNSVDKYEIQFTGSNSFTLNNLTTGQASGTFTFSAGSALNLIGGLSVTISGTPATGDTFELSVSENASRAIAISNTIQLDSKKIAAGATPSGDGQNALALAELQNTLVFEGESLKSGSGSFTFDDFYNSIVTSVAVNSKSATIGLQQQEGLQIQLFNRRESSSGVSIDEEMINLIKFQQSFAAAARIISTIEEMVDILNNQV